MDIAIIGTGNVGAALATKWSKAGHHIHLGVRDIDNFKGKELLENEHTFAHTISEAVALSEVILVATPPQIVTQLISQMGEVSGKVIIDATNSIRTKPDSYETAYHAFQDLTHAAVVKCFNSTGFENMENPTYGNFKLDMFMAGDDVAGKKVVEHLSKDAGFENCYDFGKSDRVVLLEQFAMAWINLAIFQGMGRDIGIKLLTR
ncbi:MAG: NAD(P)-binding domain-containing protein [Bacteroidota bacterium]